MAGSEKRKSTGSKPTGRGAWVGKSRDGSPTARAGYPAYAVCIDNSGHEESLLQGKVYRIVARQPGDRQSDVRVVDEEGEDYLYAAKRFVYVELSVKAQRAVSQAVPVAS